MLDMGNCSMKRGDAAVTDLKMEMGHATSRILPDPSEDRVPVNE
jgi:hypothetical protein